MQAGARLPSMPSATAKAPAAVDIPAIDWLAALQAGTEEGFVTRLGGAVEHAPWVARAAWGHRPFADVDALADAMARAILAAPREAQLRLLQGHPELAGREAQAGAMTAESTGEQGRLGLLALSRDRLQHLARMNSAYRERFGFPLIIALALHATLDSVFAEAERRLHQTPQDEWRTALDQVCHVMRGRLRRLATAPTESTSAP